MKLLTIVTIASATIVIVKKALSLSAGWFFEALNNYNYLLVCYSLIFILYLMLNLTFLVLFPTAFVHSPTYCSM